MYFLYVNIRMAGEADIYIYMSIHIFEIQMWCTCVFVLMMMMSMFPICCDRMYEMFMYV
jgi:hypothetical protein